MKKIIILALILSFNLFAVEVEEEFVVDDSITKVSDETRNLLSSEMRFIEKNMKDILFLIVAGEYEKIQEKSIGIQNSFILKKSITKEQIAELGKKLPKKFFIYDMEFHETAGQMAQAAEMEDSTLIANEYHNMIKACIKCHSTFATHRFPNLVE